MALEGKLLARARDRLEERRRVNAAETVRRRTETYARIPELRHIDDRLRGIMIELVGLALGRSDRPGQELEEESLALQARRAELLQRYGFPADWLEPIYSCPDCHDSGHLADGKTCACLRELYTQEQTAELSPLLRTGAESFENFRLDYYPLEPVQDGESPRRHMERVLQACRAWALNFGPNSLNLLFSGGPGLGKTYLAAAIARVVSASGHSVAYDSVGAVLAVFETQKFSRDSSEAADAAARARQVLGCDLLILDDLGTEMNTGFTAGALYTIINGRLVAGKKTVITTNLTADQLANRYGPQLASRLLGDFHRLDFRGKDIRLSRKESL
ncbi:MAG: ATP-binding protein [Eubacteriales bacterium]|nr:ATP-binding protein [Eubacteriales bacterium]